MRTIKFDIVEPRYSQRQRNWMTLANFIFVLPIGIVILAQGSFLHIVNSKFIGFLFLALVLVGLVLMLIINRKVIMAYNVRGHVDFNAKSLSINSKSKMEIEYRHIKSINIAPILVLPKRDYISYRSQIITDDKVYEIHVHAKCGLFKKERSLYLFKIEKYLPDILEEKNISYEIKKSSKLSINSFKL